MILTHLSVRDYRNIPAAEFSPGRELTVICGQNGQGKTNLLEAVWMLTGGKSFRGSKDAELIREGAGFAVLEGVSQNQTRENNIRILMADASAGKKGRSARVNGVDRGRASSIAGTFTAVVFAPGHLSLVKGGPDGRRKFLDAALCQLYPDYIKLLRSCTRLTAQKNALLKQYYQTPDAAELLDVFDEKLADAGTQLSLRRQAYLAQIKPDILSIYRDISNGKETLEVQYEACFTADEPLLERIRAVRGRDLAAGFCTVGPHREDFSLFLDGRDTKSFASQGQQRSAVLSLKLAEAAGAQKITGEHPVMLLDDVLSELDDARQAYLLSRMEHRQTIVTACDASLFAKTDGKVYRMESGVLSEC